jgi:hypothetical protein
VSEQKNHPTIYRLKITLKETEPAIWRRILVPSNITLHRLHLILQVVMGWSNYHLYRFQVGKNEYATPDPDNESFELDYINSKTTKLGKVVTVKGTTFIYEYDFGDGWIHNLKVEDILEPEIGVTYPICLEGERACPPEDCGGPYGYSTLLGIIVNPKHKEYKDMINWLGRDFRPALFDAKTVNLHLKPIRLDR